MIAKLRSSKHVLFLVGLAVFLLATAAAPRLQEPATPDLTNLLLQFVALAGAGALIAALVNVAKAAGLPDGQAPKASLLLNLVGFGALVLLRVFRPDTDVAALNQTAASIATALVAILGLAAQLGLTRLIHEKALKGMPLVGKSHSQEKGATLLKAEVRRRR